MTQPSSLRIGVDLGGTKIEAIALDERGHITQRERIPTPSDDYNAIVDAVVDLVATVRRSSNSPPLPVGIGTPGAVSLKTGRMKNCNTTVLNDMPLRDDLATRLGVPVRIANDADCFTLSESRDGAAEGDHSVFGVIIGTGVGGGICYKGRLLTGINAICGEWGHNTLPVATLQRQPPGLPHIETGRRPCYCGRFDCVEQWLSGPAFEQDYVAMTGRPLPARDIERAADAGDEVAGALVDRYCELLALGLSSVINILDPATVVLGGGMSNMAVIYERLPDYLSRYVFSDQVLTRVVQARHGDSSGVRGAAWLWESGEASD